MWKGSSMHFHPHLFTLCRKHIVYVSVNKGQRSDYWAQIYPFMSFVGEDHFLIYKPHV